MFVRITTYTVLVCNLFLSVCCTLRTDERHSYHCGVLDRQDLLSADKQHFSLVYGVNRRALLHTLSYFSVASGALIPDIMHDVLEGALPLEVKLMLKVLTCSACHTCMRFSTQIFVIDKKLFSLNFIDDGFKKLSFDGDKPSTSIGVSLTSCDSNLHQHGMTHVYMYCYNLASVQQCKCGLWHDFFLWSLET